MELQAQACKRSICIRVKIASTHFVTSLRRQGTSSLAERTLIANASALVNAPLIATSEPQSGISPRTPSMAGKHDIVLMETPGIHDNQTKVPAQSWGGLVMPSL